LTFKAKDKGSHLWHRNLSVCLFLFLLKQISDRLIHSFIPLSFHHSLSLFICFSSISIHHFSFLASLFLSRKTQLGNQGALRQTTLQRL